MAQPTDYKILAQRTITAIDALGMPIDAQEITFSFGAGHQGKVVIPVAGATKENTKAAIVRFIETFGDL
jgi:hypothetical protein